MVYVIADTHSNVKRASKLISKAEWMKGAALDGDDVVVILGDVFGIPKSKAKNQYSQIRGDKAMVAWCDAQPFKILAIRGNHDTARKLRVLRAKKGEYRGQPGMLVGKNLFYMDDGGVYEIPVNKHRSVSVLAMGGAFGHDKVLRGQPYNAVKSFRDKYIPLIYRTDGKPLEVDFVFSHDCPKSKMGAFKLIFGATAVNGIFDKVLPHVRFSHWYYGHHHMDIDTAKKFSCIYGRVIPISFKPSRRDKPTKHREKEAIRKGDVPDG